MQVFINISSRGCFYSEELCPSAFDGVVMVRVINEVNDRPVGNPKSKV
jgi:hypothetical protein